jgi:hypothetical protein
LVFSLKNPVTFISYGKLKDLTASMMSSADHREDANGIIPLLRSHTDWPVWETQILAAADEIAGLDSVLVDAMANYADEIDPVAPVDMTAAAGLTASAKNG